MIGGSGSEPREHRISIAEIELVCFEWNAASRGRGPTLLMAHATGFHARCWDEIIRRLGDRHVIAVDLRGHGRSTSRTIDHWRVFGEDLAALIVSLGLESIVGIGHSMGGHAMVDAAAACADRFSALFLFDPVIGAPDSYAGSQAGHFAHFAEEGHPTARRRNAFDSREAMIERFSDRLPYARFDVQVFRDYCMFGLCRAEQTEGWVLACPPEVEASIYMTSRSNEGIFESVRAIGVPVQIIRAKASASDDGTFDFSDSPTWPGLASEFADGREIHLPEATHFLPFEDPAALANRIRSYLDSIG